MKQSSAPSSTRTSPAPDNALQQGMALHQQGDLAAAEQCYRRVRKRHAAYGEALRLRALLAHQRGEHASAIKLARRATEQQPGNALFHHTLAEICKAAGRLQDAVRSYRRSWKLAPARTATGEDLAVALEQSGRTPDAIDIYRQLLPDHPQPARIRTHIAVLHHERGELPQARACMEQWHDSMSATAVNWCDLGRAWASIFEPQQAIECYHKALELAPAWADGHAGLGSALQLQGRHDQATEHLQQALTLQPDRGWVHHALLTNRGFTLDEGSRRQLEQLAADRNVAEVDRMHMQFALGMWHDRHGKAASAFEHFERGNRMHARRTPFDPQVAQDRIDRMLQHFDRDFFARREDYGDPSQRPIFIVGMPRSGTSLVEQIIASHPQAHGAGELRDIGRMVTELRALDDRGRSYPEALSSLDAQQAATLARRYLGSLEARSADAARITDKMPANHLWLGLIALLLPRARVVYCRRDAMDNCLSCYFQVFHDGLAYTYDQTHLGQVYRQHEQLMAHWAECLPLAMLTVDYESLVADPDTEIRRLIEFTGLPWDDRCLTFHNTDRAVQTASNWQVRQPMYRSSVARWQRYEPWLTPLRDSLAHHALGKPAT